MLKAKLKYLMWSASRCASADTSCPACQSTTTSQIKRKYLVTALYLCDECRLMFRVPKPAEVDNDEFYQDEYSQGFTTDCPSPTMFEDMKRTSFRTTDKDYSQYIRVLRAAGMREGQTIYDFGSSWGYGSWQLRQAGFRVYSYEISQPRARYATEKLGCQMYSPEQIPERVDCLFSAHVIEHLVNPRILWDAALKTLKPTGIVVLMTPNGEPSRAPVERNYHQLWGNVHPLLLTPEALCVMATKYGYAGRAYSSPYDSRQIALRQRGRLDGPELLLVARPN